MMRRRMGRPGLIGTAARTAVVAGTATAVVGGVSHHQQSKYEQKEMAAQAQQAAAAQAAAPPPPPPEPEPTGITPDVVNQLKELAELKDQGILTDEEFAAQKAKLLGS